MTKKINKRFKDMITLSVKPFPEDQKKMSGIGNVYENEYAGGV